MEHVVIGIEGLVGAGKTSICRNLVEILPNTILLNGGNLYRSIVYAMMKQGKSLSNLNDVKDLDIKTVMDILKVEIKIENKESNFYIDGVLAKEEDLQSQDTSLAVSLIGGQVNNDNMFEFARNLIDMLKINYNVIISGRSIMEIYPKTDYHFFIKASLEERVRRKCIQYNQEIDSKEVEENILKRDELQEKAGFYKLHDKTIVIDVTDCKNVEESTNKVLKFINVQKME